MPGVLPAGAVTLRERLGLAVMLTGTFMAVMDVMIVNVAIPSIRRTLDASFAEAELVVAGYGVAYAVALITGGRLGDLYGRRRMFRAGLAGFTLTSALCGLAPTAGTLILARLAQGVTAAVLFPQVLSLIRVTFTDPHRRAGAFAAMGVVMGLATIAGQLMGGVLVALDLWHLEWRPVFLINIPIGLAALLAAPHVIPESRSGDGARIDLAGVGLSALGIGLLLYPLVEGRERDWPAWTLLMPAAAVAVLALFGVHQHGKSRRRESPLLDTGLFRNRAFVLGLGIVLVFYSTLNSFFLSFSFLAQLGLGGSPMRTGLVFSALAAAFMAASVLTGRLPARQRGRVLLTGAGATLAGTLMSAGLALGAPPLQLDSLVLPFVVQGFGQGLLLTPLLNTIISGIDEKQAGAAAGALSTMQQVGGALGVAVVGILFFGTLDDARAAGAAAPEAYTRAFAAAALYAITAGVLTLGLLARLLRAQR